MIKPKNCLISIIQPPALGSAPKDPENVPIISSGIPRPMPKLKSKTKPRTVLPIAVTIESNKTSPGDKQGDATVPLAIPNKKMERNEPSLTC